MLLVYYLYVIGLELFILTKLRERMYLDYPVTSYLALAANGSRLFLSLPACCLPEPRQQHLESLL